jgi:hypothetical protein
MNPREQVLEEIRDPVTKQVIVRTVRLSDELIAVDLECPDAEFFGRRFLPLPIEVRDRPGKPKSRWVYRISSLT